VSIKMTINLFQE